MISYLYLNNLISIRYDSIQVHEGSSADSPMIGEKFCGKSLVKKTAEVIPDLFFPLSSTEYDTHENELYVEFKSDDTDSYSGYKIKIQPSGRVHS